MYSIVLQKCFLGFVMAICEITVSSVYLSACIEKLLGHNIIVKLDWWTSSETLNGLERFIIENTVSQTKSNDSNANDVIVSVNYRK